MADRNDKNSDRPRGGKPAPRGDRKFAGKPRGDRGARPAKPWQGKRQDGSFKPRGGKPGGDGSKPAGERADRPRDRKFTPGNRPPRREAESSAAVQAEAQASERIAKRLARAGIASRRDAEALIADGRVKVNGKVLSSPAFNVSASDRIEVDSAEIPPIERTRLFLFNKPAGVVTTNRDPEGRRTVFDVLPADLPRLMTVGRLDINTEGLLLLTNDGGLARLLELPATGWLRRYRARVHGKVDAGALAGLKDGIAVDGAFYGSIEASLDREQGSNAWLTIGLREGKNREVKNILGALGLEVTRLIRISYGPFQLGELAEGAVQELKGRMLRDQLGERLIEEAGANFEAPVVKPFSNKPVDGDTRHERADKPRIVRDGIQGREGPGGLIKQRKRDYGDERASALSRLTTKPEGKPFDKGDGGRSFDKGDRGKPFDKGDRGKPFDKGDRGKPFDKGDRGKPFGGKPVGGKPFAGKDERAEPHRARTSNVWMAPGARPAGKKHNDAESPSPGSRGEGKGEGQRGPRKFGSKPFGGGKKKGSPAPRGRGDGGRGPAKGRGGADRRR